MTASRIKSTKRLESSRPAVVKPTPKVTVPKSPNFSTYRSRDAQINPLAISAQTSFLSTPFKARPAPKFGKPFEPIRPHRHTVPQDIKLPGDYISQAKRQRLENDRKDAVTAMSRLALQTPARKVHASAHSTPKQLEDQENRPHSNAQSKSGLKKITIPQSPKFSTNNRIRQRHLKSEDIKNKP